MPNQLISILAIFFFLPYFIDNGNRHWLLKVKQNYLEWTGTVCLTEGLEEELSSPRWTRQAFELICSSLNWIPALSILLFPVLIAWGDACCIVWGFWRNVNQPFSFKYEMTLVGKCCPRAKLLSSCCLTPSCSRNQVEIIGWKIASFKTKTGKSLSNCHHGQNRLVLGKSGSIYCQLY